MNRLVKSAYILAVSALLLMAASCDKDEPQKDKPGNPTPDYVDKEMKDPNVPIPEL